MNRSQQAKVDSLYRQHVNALKRQGKAVKTIDAYACAVRRLSEFFDANPADITQLMRFCFSRPNAMHKPRAKRAAVCESSERSTRV